MSAQKVTLALWFGLMVAKVPEILKVAASGRTLWGAGVGATVGTGVGGIGAGAGGREVGDALGVGVGVGSGVGVARSLSSGVGRGAGAGRRGCGGGAGNSGNGALGSGPPGGIDEPTVGLTMGNREFKGNRTTKKLRAAPL